jgi:hypothetical protein
MLFGIYMDERDIKMAAEEVNDLRSLISSQQSIIHEDTLQAIADHPMEKKSDDRGIDSSTQAADHSSRTDPFPQMTRGLFHKRPHVPEMLTVTDTEEKITDEVDPFAGMDHLWMKLKPVDPSPAIFDGGKERVAGMGDRMKPGRQAPDLVSMAHPYLERISFFSNPFKESSHTVDDQPGFSVFSLLGMGDLPS